MRMIVHFQLRRPSSVSPRGRASYAVRFVFSFIAMEFVLHYMYVVAIKDTKAWNGDTPFQLAMIGYWNLKVLWLKVRRNLLDASLNSIPNCSLHSC